MALLVSTWDVLASGLLESRPDTIRHLLDGTSVLVVAGLVHSGVDGLVEVVHGGVLSGAAGVGCLLGLLLLVGETEGDVNGLCDGVTLVALPLFYSRLPFWIFLCLWNIKKTR